MSFRPGVVQIHVKQRINTRRNNADQLKLSHSRERSKKQIKENLNLISPEKRKETLILKEPWQNSVHKALNIYLFQDFLVDIPEKKMFH